MTPKIILSPAVALNLENLVHTTREQEFSGLGLVNVVDGDLVVYDIVLMNVGSMGFTEISAEDLIKLNRPDKANIRLWFHRHPVEGWSGTDVNTITTAPLGGIPEIVRWSASIVRTPTRWIGRIDDHIHKTSLVAEVTPNVDVKLSKRAIILLDKYWKEAEKASRTYARFPFPISRPTGLAQQYNFIDDMLGEDDDAEDDEWLDAQYEDDEFTFAEDDTKAFIARREYLHGRMPIGMDAL